MDSDTDATLVFINGPCGVGKTALAWALLDTLRHSVMLDLDAIGALNPYVLECAEREAYLLETLALLVDRHRRAGYRYFILPYVFSGPAMYDRVVQLSAPGATVFKFRLDASDRALRERIVRRSSSDAEWELARMARLRELFEGAWHDPEEVVIDTTDLELGEVMFHIKARLLASIGQREAGRHPHLDPGS